MLRPVGEIFELNGVRLEVVECETCDGCYFKLDKERCSKFVTYDKIGYEVVAGVCSPFVRNESVIFKEVK